MKVPSSILGLVTILFQVNTYRVLQIWSDPMGPIKLSPKPRPIKAQTTLLAELPSAACRDCGPQAQCQNPPTQPSYRQSGTWEDDLPSGAGDLSAYRIMRSVGSSPNIQSYVPYLLLHSHRFQRKRPVRVHHRRPSRDLGVRLGCSTVKRRPPNGRLSGPASAAQASLILSDGWQRVEQPEPRFRPL